MPTPKIFVYIQQDRLQKQLSSVLARRGCHFIYPAADAQWQDELLNADADLALIEVADDMRAGLIQLHDTRLPSQLEWILISDGQPNPDLDQLIRRSAGFHLRPPLDLKLLQELMDDFIADYAAQQSSDDSAQVTVSELDQFGLLVGSSKSMHKLYRTLRKVANSETQVLIMGESGAGKELVAHTLHLSSQRNTGPFIAVNCGALSPELVDSELFGHIKGAFTGAVRDHQGFFAQAEGGTLFLDEVTEMPLAHQVKLLRVLENREYRPIGSQQLKKANVRVIAATNRDPADAIAQEIFREDLYFRLAQFPLNIPPLRERDDDITGLAKHFLAYRNAQEQTEVGIANDALEKIADYHWPGNVRELKHSIERAYILADEVIEAQHLQLQQDFLGDGYKQNASLENIPTGIPLEELTRAAIEATLEENQGNRKTTAEQLGISVKTLYNKLEKYQQEEE
ncbi:ATPase AAA [Shewanella mangrovi]|uniref:ATPase AAA n=1 Tax=Shewanella mangrovi TaxID=1515746 RepID=A0A094K1L0_9GAMM|nr:sigma-54 dependent transcriptional regulator [Shewanella mangrovi]KFZ38546.1 ATPase AAA [Shewanella mangrovi]